MEDNKQTNVDTQQQEQNEVSYTQEQVDQMIAEATKDLLSQDKVNEIVKERLAKEKSKQLEKQKEAERLASMSAEQRAKAEFEMEMKAKQEEYEAQMAEFQAMKSEFEKAQLLAQTQKELSDRGLSVDMAQILLRDTAENTLEAIKVYEETYKKDLENGINSKLKKSTEPTPAKEGTNATKNPKDMTFAEFVQWKSEGN
jgi:hypothetical protein